MSEKRTKSIEPQDIHRGYVISIPGSKTYGLVYDIERDTNGSPVSCRYLPIRESQHHGRLKCAPNNVFELYTNTKKQFGLPPKKNFILTYELSTLDLSPDNHPLGIAIRERTGHQNAPVGIFNHMLHILQSQDPELAALLAEKEAPPYVFHRNEPTHVKKRRKPTQAETMDITLDEAVKLKLLKRGIVDILTATSENGNILSTLKSAFQVSSTPGFSDLVSAGIHATHITLADAFNAGLINESRMTKPLKSHGITTLSGAINAIESTHEVMQSITPVFRQDISQSPTIMAQFAVQSAWKKLAGMVLSNDPELLQSGIRFMHPVRKHG